MRTSPTRLAAAASLLLPLLPAQAEPTNVEWSTDFAAARALAAKRHAPLLVTFRCER